MRILSDAEFYLKQFDAIPDNPPPALVSDSVEGVRVLPEDSPFPGLWRTSRTPYLMEPMNWAGPYSGVNESAHMWGAQLGKTAGLIENPLQYYMKVQPTKVLFITATLELAKRWSGDRLDKLIDSCGIRVSLQEQTDMKSGRKSADTTFVKEYPGGSLFISSAQAAANLRATSFLAVFIDEVDGAKADLNSGEGKFADVARARTFAFRGSGRYKIVMVSTPTTYEESEIYQSYLLGDQCKYLVPCPYCGAFQELQWHDDPDAAVWGLKPVYEAGLLVDAVYLCEHCRDPIKNHQKTWMLSSQNGAHWAPQTTSSVRNFRSTQLAGLYSPVGMFSWVDAWGEFDRARAQGDDELRAFTNTVLGLPYQPRGTQPEVAELYSLRGQYHEMTVPFGVVFLTAFVDVQRGSKSKGTKPRLELEVKGHGVGFRTWSICYKVFEGSIDNPFDGAWKSFVDWLATAKFFSTMNKTQQFGITLGGIDSGDGSMTSVIYSFLGSKQVQGFVATKGERGKAQMTNKKGDLIDKEMYGSRRHFRYSSGKDGSNLVVISTLYYKHHLYKNLEVRRDLSGNNPPGYCDFPIEYGEDYFKQLTAEKRLSDGTFWLAKGIRNEALDCHVGNCALADVVISQIREVEQDRMRRAGRKEAEVRSLTRDHIMESYLQPLNLARDISNK